MELTIWSETGDYASRLDCQSIAHCHFLMIIYLSITVEQSIGSLCEARTTFDPLV